MTTLTWSATASPDRAKDVLSIASFMTSANVEVMKGFLFDEPEESGQIYSLGLKGLREWLLYDFPNEAVDDVVDPNTKPVVKETILCTRTSVDQALSLLSEAQHLRSELFMSLAKAASTAQYMIDGIRKSYGTTDLLANRKVALTEKWLEDEKKRIRHDADEKDNTAQVAVHAASEHVLAMFRKVPESAWGPMMCEKLGQWTELEATQIEAIKVVQARVNAGLAPNLEAPQDLKQRVLGSATPQKGESARAVHELEAGYHDHTRDAAAGQPAEMQQLVLCSPDPALPIPAAPNDVLGRGISSDRQPDVDAFDEAAFHAELCEMMKSPLPTNAQVESKPAETGGKTSGDGLSTGASGDPDIKTSGDGISIKASRSPGIKTSGDGFSIAASRNPGIKTPGASRNPDIKTSGDGISIAASGNPGIKTSGDGVSIAASQNPGMKSSGDGIPDVKTGGSIPTQVPKSAIGSMVSALNRRDTAELLQDGNMQSQQEADEATLALAEAEAERERLAIKASKVRIAHKLFLMLLPTAIAVTRPILDRDILDALYDEWVKSGEKWLESTIYLEAKRKETTQYKGQERYISKKTIREKHGKLQAENLVKEKKMLQEQHGNKYDNMPHWMEHPDFRGVEDEELFLIFDDFVIENKAKDTKATTFGTGANLDGAMTGQIMSPDPMYRTDVSFPPAIMQSGALRTGLTAPPVALNLSGTVNQPYGQGSSNPASKGGQKGGGKGHSRSNRSHHAASPKRGVSKATPLTQATAKLRDASSKLIDAKCWTSIIEEKTEISQAMKDGYATDMKKHRELMQDASEKLQHATLTGPKDGDTLSPLTEILDKAVEGYNAFVKTVKVVFALWYFIVDC
ncbi:unnamed protein product [Symbiodinium sp. CCMP2592]|nr:unnamed protein product [Symbiodinium sp. CCMP2592]